MGSTRLRTNFFRSLKFQFCVGAIFLLTITLASVSYLLIEQQKRILVGELRKTIVLQGRNIALSSSKALLRSDPEYELYPILKRISSRHDGITFLVITDADDVIQAHLELQNVGTPLELPDGAYQRVETDIVENGESLFDDKDAFLLKTPISGLGKTIGFVYMTYSKKELRDSAKRAVGITLICTAAALVLGIVLSLVLYRRISRPLDNMVEGVNAFGRGEIDTRIDLPGTYEFQVLAGSFNEMASRLHAAQNELIEKKITDRELEIAHDIQRTLIPADIRQPDGYEISIHYQAALQVGGDYVDVIPIDSSRIAFVMADVSGKGIPGLVVMAMLKVMVHEMIKKHMPPSQIVRKLNLALAANMRPNMFVTLFLGILDTKSGEITISNAGHEPVVYFDSAKRVCAYRRITGRPLGLFDDKTFVERLEENRLRLQCGDLILLYTDGLTESKDGKSNQFGRNRLIRLCEAHAYAGAAEVVTRMLEAERSFRGDSPQADDLTLLAIGAVGPRSGREANIDMQPEELCLSR